MINSERTGSDSVELWNDNDDKQYIRINRYNNTWIVVKRRRRVLGVGEELGRYNTAQEAVNFAKDYLESGEQELDEALENISPSQ